MDEFPRQADHRIYLRLNYHRLRSLVGPDGVDPGAKRILAGVPASESVNLAMRITPRDSADYNPLGQFGVAWSLG